MKKIIALFATLLTIAVVAYANDDNTKDKSNVINLTKTEFIEKVTDFENIKEWAYKGDKPAIIDFYADWCGPCRKLSPILEEIATEFKDEIYVYKINTDKEPEIATAVGIRVLPTLLFIPLDGKPKSNEGFIPKENLIKIVDSVLLKK